MDARLFASVPLHCFCTAETDGRGRGGTGAAARCWVCSWRCRPHNALAHSSCRHRHVPAPERWSSTLIKGGFASLPRSPRLLTTPSLPTGGEVLCQRRLCVCAPRLHRRRVRGGGGQGVGPGRRRRARGAAGAPGLWLGQGGCEMGCVPGLAAGRGELYGCRGWQGRLLRAGTSWLARPTRRPMRRPHCPPSPPRSCPPTPQQEYTNKLAAVQGKGDEYEAAAAQVRRVLRRVWKCDGAPRGLCSRRLMLPARALAGRAPPQRRPAVNPGYAHHVSPPHHPPAVAAQVGVEVYSAMNAALGP